MSPVEGGRVPRVTSLLRRLFLERRAETETMIVVRFL